jgi:hypothetical protein
MMNEHIQGSSLSTGMIPPLASADVHSKLKFQSFFR